MVMNIKEQYNQQYGRKKVLYDLNFLKGQKKNSYDSIKGNWNNIHDKEFVFGIITGTPKSSRSIKFEISLCEGNVIIKGAKKELVDKGIKSNMEHLNKNGSNDKCSYIKCNIDENLSMESCVICHNKVHHICSNEIYEDELHIRICSDKCKEQYLSKETESTSHNNIQLYIQNNQINQNNINKQSITYIIDNDLQYSESSEQESDSECIMVDDDDDDESQEDDNQMEVKEIKKEVLHVDENILAMMSEKELSKMEWNEDDKNITNHPDLFRNNYKLKLETLYLCKNPIEVFMTFFTDTLWNKIVEETNRYKNQNNWNKIKDITREELQKFVGLLIARSLNPWTNGLKNHWRKFAQGFSNIFYILYKLIINIVI